MNTPNVYTRIVTFAGARKEWVQAGKPVRTPERIKQIHEECCTPCEHYDGSICRICGCFVNLSNGMNKLRWATTKCPDDPPKWVAENGVPEESIKEGDAAESTATSPEPAEIKPQEEKPDGGCGCGK